MISQQEIVKKGTLDEVLFRGRNKDYGAFELRQVYPTHIRKSAMILILAAAGLLITSKISDYIAGKNPIIFPSIPASKPTDVYMGHDKPIEEENFKKIIEDLNKGKVATQTATTPVIVETAPAEVEIKPMAALLEDPRALGATDSKGSPGDLSTPVIGNGAGADNGIQNGDFVEMPEIDPVFPGGEDALNVYLQQSISFTNAAIDNDEQGTVLVEFVISETGEIQNIKVLEGLDYGLTKIAVNAIKNMPRWSPAEFGGHKVKVSKVVPIEFVLDKP